MTPETQDQPATVAPPETEGGSAATTGSAAEPMRDSLTGLTSDARADFDRFINGPDWDSDPLRRYTRSHGGRCSGGGGCC
jgi:hypothetical protein